MRILLDPGHGGDHVGAQSVSGLLEKALTLALAERVAERLAAFDVHYSRVEDHHVSHRVRARMAAKVDLTLSFHYHVSGNPHLRQVQAGARVSEGEAIARLVLDHLKAVLGEPTLYRPTSARICNHTKTPVVIVMAGMLSNAEVERGLLDGDRLEVTSGAIADAVLQHYAVPAHA